jgi:hypothetical protein
MTPSPGDPATGAPSSGDIRRRDMVRQVGVAIGKFAEHLATNEGVARAIGDVSVQAKKIAFKAWKVMAGGRDVQKVARELAGDLTDLAKGMETLAGRAGQEAIVSEEAASMLTLAATEFDAIAGNEKAVADLATLRKRLGPLLTQLESIPERLVEGKAIAQAFSERAKAASSLAARGNRLCDEGKPGEIVQAVYDGMNDLASQTSKLSTWITANAERGYQVSLSMASCVETLSKPPTRPEAVAADNQLSAVIGRGRAIVW